ncbi:MAG: SPFH domain-containing protein [Endomicrobiales bacterium]
MIGLFFVVAAGVAIFILLIAILILPSIRVIGQTEVGLVSKRFGRKLTTDNPVALKGEAGYQADLLMPGWRFKLWIMYNVEKFPWVQVPAGEIGVVIAQVGAPLPIGAKSAIFDPVFGNFSDLRAFVENRGQKGVQRPVLSPGTLAPLHPVGFLVITKNRVYGSPIDSRLKHVARKEGLTPEHFGLQPEQLVVVRIKPNPALKTKSGEVMDTVGIVTAFEGQPLEGADIASRLGGFADVELLEQAEKDDASMIEALFSNKNKLHNNYQDFQKFIEAGGKIGLQHDPLLYGAYNLNPFLVSVETVPMLIVEQGEVAVIKSYVGLVTKDTSGEEFKFGSLVRPGHCGIWREPLRTGKYPINPRCYQSEIVPTSILTLNWSDATSKAHNLDANLKQIDAKSCEGFIFAIDLQVQIHVPDTQASRVISMVGTMLNLVNEVLQAAVGNHFRDKLQSMPAVRFIETRQQVQEEAFGHISKKLNDYRVETKGVYIQDVVLPEKLVEVLTQREIANQQIETYKKQQESQKARIDMENTQGQADKQKELAGSQVEIQIKKNTAEAVVAQADGNARARKTLADGEATYIQKTGEVSGAQILSIGEANAKAYKLQVESLGQTGTILVNVVKELQLKDFKGDIVPKTLIVGGGGDGVQNGVLSNLMGFLGNLSSKQSPAGKIDSTNKTINETGEDAGTKPS